MRFWNKVLIPLVMSTLMTFCALSQAAAQTPSTSASRSPAPTPQTTTQAKKVATPHQSNPRPVSAPQVPVAIHASKSQSRKGGGAKLAKPTSRAGTAQPATPSGNAGVGPGCTTSDMSVSTTDYSPDPSTGTWTVKMDNNCVPASGSTWLEQAYLVDYNGNQIGGQQQYGPESNNATPFVWTSQFGAVNLPTAPGTYKYTVHTYRNVHLPDTGSTGSYFNSPDVFCNDTSRTGTAYGLFNQTPYGTGLYFDEYCYDAESYTLTIQSGSCAWSNPAVNLTQDGQDDAEAVGGMTCSGLPSDTTSHGDMEFDDWSGTNVGPQTYSAGGGSSGFRVDTGMVPFPDCQQLQAKLTSTVSFTPSDGWTWGSGGCTITNNGLTAICVATSNGITTQEHFPTCPSNAEQQYFFSDVIANANVVGHGPEGGPGPNCHVNVSTSNGYNVHIQYDGSGFFDENGAIGNTPDQAASTATGQVQAYLGVQVGGSDYNKLWGPGTNLFSTLDAALGSLEGLY